MTQDDFVNDSKREREFRSNREVDKGPVINIFANLRSLEVA